MDTGISRTIMESACDDRRRAVLEREGRDVRESVARACSIDLSPPVPVTMTCMLHLEAPLALRAIEDALLRRREEAGAAGDEKRTLIRFDPADGTAFRNQLTLRLVQRIEGCDRRRVVSCKLFARGLVHMTGARTLEEVSAAWKTLRHFVRGLFGSDPPALIVVRCSPVMVNSSCKVSKSGSAAGLPHVIVPKKLIAAVRHTTWCGKSPAATCAYDPSVYSGLKIKRDVGTLLIFSSGSVVISSRTTEGTWTLWMMLGAMLKKDPSALKRVAREVGKDRKEAGARPGLLTVDYDAELLAL